MKKRVQGTSDSRGPLHLAAVETECLRAFGQIVAHLTVMRYDDGSPRRPGTVTLRTLGPTWQAEARDYDAGLRLRVIGDEVDTVLLMLDALLGSDDAPWEPDEYLQGRVGKKK